MAEKRQYCGHCKEYISKTVYHQHKRLYFDKVSKKWASHRFFFEDDSGIDSFKPGDQASNSTRCTPENDGTNTKYHYNFGVY